MKIEKSCYKCLHCVNEVDYGNGSTKYECKLFDETIRDKSPYTYGCDKFISYKLADANFRNIEVNECLERLKIMKQNLINKKENKMEKYISLGLEKVIDCSKDYNNNEVFSIKKGNDGLVGVYIHDDGWLHFKMSFHKKFIDELIKKLEDIK